MRPAHPTEQAVGMDYYVSDTSGVGGRLRASDEHFRVRELERFSTESLEATTDAYPHLVVRATLSGWDTNDFASRISDALGVSRERVSWAGTKDKYAVTTQLFSIYGAEPEDLPDVDGAEIEVIGRAGRSLEFGDLAGNEFELVVSDPEHPENAKSITEELAEFVGVEGANADSDSDSSSGPNSSASTDSDSAPNSSADPTGGTTVETTIGVPNFFGQQRFGSRRPITHEVGLEIVREDWEGAVMAYLGNPTETEPEATQEARGFVEETRDWQEALERFPSGLRYERSMLHELAERKAGDGTDELAEDAFRAALERLPSNLQRLFVHAAQSYVFNRICSERLERGLPFDRPIEGDVVCFADRDAPEGLVLPDTDREQRVTGRRVRSITRHCERGRAFVTAPLVGTETELAGGEQGEIERAILEDEGLEPADFDLPGEFHSTGTRRAILVRTDAALEYGDEREGEDEAVRERERGDENGARDRETRATSRTPLTPSLSLSFSLPKGSYATVVMREYLKVDPVDLG